MKADTIKRTKSMYIQDICVICNKGKQSTSGVCKKTNRRKYRATCTPCDLRKRGLLPTSAKRRKFLIYKKLYCEFCGFIPIHTCQLDVDHIDGNNKNNDPINLQTLCANCHRLKTFNNKEYNKNIS